VALVPLPLEVAVGPLGLLDAGVAELILDPPGGYYDGKAVGKGRVEKTQPMRYSADEACDVGGDTGSPASPDYGPTGNTFNGDIAWVQIDLGTDSHDHLITAEDRLRIAMARH
jgi:hypothetical protein